MFVSCERIKPVPATPFDHSRSLEDLLVSSVCAKESESVRGCCSRAEHGVSKTQRTAETVSLCAAVAHEWGRSGLLLRALCPSE